MILIILTASCSRDLSNKFEYTAIERLKYMNQADLVFQGSLKKIEMIKRESIVDVMENSPDLNYIATFVINKIEKGGYNKKTLRIAIHSPTLALQVYPSEYSKGNKKKYRIYIRSSARGSILIGKELIARK